MENRDITSHKQNGDGGRVIGHQVLLRAESALTGGQKPQL